MKKFVSIILLFAISIGAIAQKSPVIKIDWKKNEVALNAGMLTNNSRIEAVEKTLGKANRILEDSNSKLHIYDSLGLNFIINKENSVIKKIDVYCSKGKREFNTSPKNLFTGEFYINDKQLAFTDSIETIKSKTQLPFEELAPGFYWYDVYDEEFGVTIAYKDKTRQQFSIIFIVLNGEQ